MARTKQTHCKRGHPFEGENLHTYTLADGRVKRECRACRQEWNRTARLRRKTRVPLREGDPITWVNAYAADGPKVAEWLAREMPWLTATKEYGGDEAAARRIPGWRAGARVDFWALDALLTRHGRHVYELPDDFWLPGYARQAA